VRLHSAILGLPAKHIRLTPSCAPNRFCSPTPTNLSVPPLAVCFLRNTESFLKRLCLRGSCSVAHIEKCPKTTLDLACPHVIPEHKPPVFPGLCGCKHRNFILLATKSRPPREANHSSSALARAVVKRQLLSIPIRASGPDKIACPKLSAPRSESSSCRSLRSLLVTLAFLALTAACGRSFSFSITLYL
jgi:hypothetical protein